MSQPNRVGVSGESQRGADSASDPSLERRRPAPEVAATDVHLNNGSEAEPRKAEVNWTATEVMVNAIEAVEVNDRPGHRFCQWVVE